MKIETKFEVGQEVWFVNGVLIDDFTFTKGVVEKIQISDKLLYRIQHNSYGETVFNFKYENELFDSFEELEKFVLLKQNKMINDYLKENLRKLELSGIKIEENA